jgi:predicted Zn-dependent protease
VAQFAKGMRLVLAQVYVETGETDRAAAQIDRILAVDPKNPGARAARASLDALQGKHLARAEKTLKQLVKSQPRNLWFQWWLASVLVKRGQMARGLARMEKLVKDEVLGRNPVCFDELGDVYHRRNHPGQARKAWEEALKRFPQTTEPGDRRKKEIENKLAALKRD